MATLRQCCCHGQPLPTQNRAIITSKSSGFRAFCLLRGPIMIGRPPRQPVDLAALAQDLRLRCKRIAGNLDAIAQEQDPLIADPKTTMLELVLAEIEICAAIEAMRRVYWPVI
jgi:hypothetical protein